MRKCKLGQGKNNVGKCCTEAVHAIEEPDSSTRPHDPDIISHLMQYLKDKDLGAISYFLYTSLLRPRDFIAR
jgi:hypothetical protein